MEVPEKSERTTQIEKAVLNICRVLQDNDFSIKDGLAALEYAKAAVQKSSKCVAEPFDLIEFAWRG